MQPPSIRRICCVAFAFLTVSTIARAQTTEPMTAGDGLNSHRWSLSVEGFGTVDLTNRDVKMAGPLVGVYYDWNKDFTIGLELGGMHVWQDNDTNTIVGNLFLKNYLFEANDTRFFIDFGGGIFRAVNACRNRARTSTRRFKSDSASSIRSAKTCRSSADCGTTISPMRNGAVRTETPV